MFAPQYFAPRYFAPRYFPPSVTETVEPPVALDQAIPIDGKRRRALAEMDKAARDNLEADWRAREAIEDAVGRALSNPKAPEPPESLTETLSLSEKSITDITGDQSADMRRKRLKVLLLLGDAV